MLRRSNLLATMSGIISLGFGDTAVSGKYDFIVAIRITCRLNCTLILNTGISGWKKVWSPPLAWFKKVN